MMCAVVRRAMNDGFSLHKVNIRPTDVGASVPCGSVDKALSLISVSYVVCPCVPIKCC